MIGVVVQPAEQVAAREFFELCKTPWEFFRGDGQYEVLICTSEPVHSPRFPLVLVFNGECPGPAPPDGVTAAPRRGHCAFFFHEGIRLPIYGLAATFPAGTPGILEETETRHPAVHARRANGTTIVRIGYNLFEETRFLLESGQPAENAGTATLELHIALLRDLVTRAGIPLVEIPPVPDGHRFMVCLTHDIDHPVLRNHCCDRTMAGFLYRASFGSLLDLCRGRRSVASLWRNWMAAARLPLVYLGIARDFWREFDERYLEIEAGLGSTYFFIPQKDYPGRRRDGPAPAMRACRYSLNELAPQLKRIAASGSEVGLHGLDAWLGAAEGRGERERVAQVTESAETGVRMHWLYFDGASPAALEEAGFAYDSTFGYNETVGYRAGTAQAYRPLGNSTLMELPLHIMDTALFYPSHLNLRKDEAWRVVCRMFDEVTRFGGALTVNWHDRSIAPERLWDDFYLRMLRELRRRGVWFPTAAQAVSWFRARRSAVVEAVRVDANRIRVRGRAGRTDGLPGLKLRVHPPRPRTPSESLATGPAPDFFDVQLNGTVEMYLSV